MPKTKIIVTVLALVLAVQYFSTPARASSTQILTDAVVTSVSGTDIKAKQDGKKYKINADDADFYRADGKKIKVDEIRKKDHISVWGTSKSSLKITADKVKNLSIFKPDKDVRGKIRSFDRKLRTFVMSTSDYGRLEVKLADDTVIKNRNGKKITLDDLKKKYKVDVEGVLDTARKTIYGVDTIQIVSK